MKRKYEVSLLVRFNFGKLCTPDVFINFKTKKEADNFILLNRYEVVQYITFDKKGNRKYN